MPKESSNFHDNIVRFKKGTGSKNIVFIHDGGGEVIQYLEFCKYISLEYSVYGIRFNQKDINYAPKVHDIKEIAKQYYESLSKLEVFDIYAIVGYCIGGKIAYEIVKQFNCVEHLILLNAIPPNQQRQKYDFTLPQEQKFIRQNHIPFRSKKATINTTEELWLQFTNYISKHKIIFYIVKKAMPEYMKKLISSFRIENDPHKVIKSLNLVRGFEETHYRYIVDEKKENVKAYYFNAVEESIENYQYWENLVTDIQFIDVKTDHLGLVHPDNIKYMNDIALSNVWGKVMIKINNLEKSFKNGNQVLGVLNNISTIIPEGKLITILGPSGSGKTTFLNIVAGLDQSDSGSIYWDNIDFVSLKEKEKEKIRVGRIGYIFQEYFLLNNLTLLENVHLAGKLVGKTKEDAKIALEKVGLKGMEHKLPDQLSGGQKQRVAIARAIVKNPDVLICDEPTGALDTVSSMNVLSVLKDIQEQEKTTIIMVTHNEKIAKISDKVIYLKDGKIQEEREIIACKVSEVDW